MVTGSGWQEAGHETGEIKHIQWRLVGHYSKISQTNTSSVLDYFLAYSLVIGN